MNPRDMYRRALGVLKFTALLSLALIMLPMAVQAKGQGEPDALSAWASLLQSRVCRSVRAGESAEDCGRQ